MTSFKLQSAMEYLMTYGWALLIISIVIVALVSIGVFNGSPLGTSCIANPGYTCQIQSGSYSAATGNLVVTIGQDSGASWTTANVVFINASNEPSVLSSGLSTSQLTPMPSGTANTLSSGLASGVKTTVTLPATGAQSVGHGINGYIWVSYTTGASNGATIQANIGSLTAKAT